MTSLLREEVSKPIVTARSRTSTSQPESAKARAVASPITPAPTTTHSTSSTDTPDIARPPTMPGEGAGCQRQRTSPVTAGKIGWNIDSAQKFDLAVADQHFRSDTCRPTSDPNEQGARHRRSGAESVYQGGNRGES